ncbi:hypothetical protein PIB30_104587, partial [Stylosanthes scabra]|nr:hypothetical protein [Stylosanthes scabra]
LVERENAAARRSRRRQPPQLAPPSVIARSIVHVAARNSLHGRSSLHRPCLSQPPPITFDVVEPVAEATVPPSYSQPQPPCIRRSLFPLLELTPFSLSQIPPLPSQRRLPRFTFELCLPAIAICSRRLCLSSGRLVLYCNR